MANLLASARAGGYGVGYFEAWDGVSMEAVLEAAEEERSPVILGFGCMMTSGHWLDNGGLEQHAGIGTALASRAEVPVALLLNEAQTEEQAHRALGLGFNAVMLDTSNWPVEEAIRAVSNLVREAHSRGVIVEAELGKLPDFHEGSVSEGRLTDPEEAAAFVEATGADCLAVSIGNVHLQTEGRSPVDLQRLAAIRERVSVPFVIHGGTGFPPDAVAGAIALGAVKFNVGTELKRAYLEAVKQGLSALPAGADVHAVAGSHKDQDFLHAGKEAMKAKVRERMRLYGSSGRA
jgi:ketose-bisphosphate aldolase